MALRTSSAAEKGPCLRSGGTAQGRIEMRHGAPKGLLLTRLHPSPPDVRQIIGEELDEAGKADGAEGNEGLLRTHGPEGDDAPVPGR